MEKHRNTHLGRRGHSGALEQQKRREAFSTDHRRTSPQPPPMTLPPTAETTTGAAPHPQHHRRARPPTSPLQKTRGGEPREERPPIRHRPRAAEGDAAARGRPATPAPRHASKDPGTEESAEAHPRRTTACNVGSGGTRSTTTSPLAPSHRDRHNKSESLGPTPVPTPAGPRSTAAPRPETQSADSS